MPTKQNKKKPHHNSQDHAAKRHAQSEKLQHDEVEEVIETSANDVNQEEALAGAAQNEDVKLEFPYSELVRAYVPKAMDVAEKVATDWKKDGSFMNLGIDNPYANMAVSLGLKKAKELEKKLDEKGVLSVVRMGVEVLKQQVNKKK
jgi:hypothetical protein